MSAPCSVNIIQILSDRQYDQDEGNGVIGEMREVVGGAGAVDAGKLHGWWSRGVAWWRRSLRMAQHLNVIPYWYRRTRRGRGPRRGGGARDVGEEGGRTSYQPKAERKHYEGNKYGTNKCTANEVLNESMLMNFLQILSDLQHSLVEKLLSQTPALERLTAGATILGHTFQEVKDTEVMYKGVTVSKKLYLNIMC
ncbi:hypothetical protein FIBSPDRAFT_886653 [Athelia psychrophila]|uniref:Uncharacterized protein n=1 Tax=Athelia psychrophila TaxID=1759441 RepID=A0A166QQR0_9AGAM|nr:hypothetical protein FIBSPDRAFT_886653 [Fibularhizoctonia sp. CBS 109695]